MKSLLILLLLSAGLATSASAQAGWGTSDSWDAPKKKTVKKSTAPARKSQAATQDKAMNNGATAAPEATAAAPEPTAPVPAGGGFGGGASSSAPMGMGMSAAPGTPVMMQSGRNVLRDDAIAARERRMLHRAGKQARVAPAPAEVPISAPAAAPLTGASAGAMGASNAANGQIAAPAAAKSARSTPAPKKKAPAAPAGW